MFMNALTRCRMVVDNIGVYGVSLHALTERAYRLYYKYGFRQHAEANRFPFMILPTKSLIELTGP
jgi:hypothetical protein